MKPEDSLELAATAVEPVQVVRGSEFWHGGLAGFAAAGLLVQLWLATQVVSYRAGFQDTGNPVPLALSSWWLWGAPAMQTLAVAALVWRRPGRVWWYAGAALATVGCVVATWWLATAPMTELAAASGE
jgi:hypothetical protein